MRIGKGLCWIVTALIAAPSFADEAPSRDAPPILAVDAYALLLADAQVRPTSPGPDAVPGFDLRSPAGEIDFTGANTLRAQDLAALSSAMAQTEPGFDPIFQFDPSADGRRVAGELMPVTKNGRRRTTPLSAMLTLRIDGDAASPPIDVEGGAGALLNALPR